MSFHCIHSTARAVTGENRVWVVAAPEEGDPGWKERSAGREGGSPGRGKRGGPQPGASPLSFPHRNHQVGLSPRVPTVERLGQLAS